MSAFGDKSTLSSHMQRNLPTLMLTCNMNSEGPNTRQDSEFLEDKLVQIFCRTSMNKEKNVQVRQFKL